MKKIFLILLCVVIALLIYFNLPISRKSLNEVSTWCYQLQGKGGAELKLEELEKLSCDLLVTDYSRTGSEKDEWKKSDVKRLQKSGKTVLSYLSIGEAEEVRFYYKTLNKKLIYSENQATGADASLRPKLQQVIKSAEAQQFLFRQRLNPNESLHIRGAEKSCCQSLSWQSIRLE